jgi:hypothetical protein
MQIKEFDVYCLTPAGRCQELEVYLGTSPKDIPLKCPICGRWSAVTHGKAKRREAVVRDPVLVVPRV